MDAEPLYSWHVSLLVQRQENRKHGNILSRPDWLLGLNGQGWKDGSDSTKTCTCIHVFSVFCGGRWSEVAGCEVLWLSWLNKQFWAHCGCFVCDDDCLITRTACLRCIFNGFYFTLCCLVQKLHKYTPLIPVDSFLLR